jgi:hypothetical protein
MKSEAKTIPSCSLLSRRAVIAGTASITAGSMLPTAGLAALPSLTSPTEGVFLVFTDTGGGHPADGSRARVFFISSGWLELFEVTGVYQQQSLSAQGVADKIRMSSSARIKRFKALYADGLDSSQNLKGAIAGATIIPPVPPGPNQTYLAMSIGEGDVP